MTNDPRSTGEAPPETPSRLRIFGPVAVAYAVATALTGAHFWGDSIDYAEGTLSGAHFWDFGHLFWRPLGWLLLHLLPSWLFSSGDERARTLLLFQAVCWLAGLGSVLCLRALLHEAAVRPRRGDLVCLLFLLSQTFLNYAQTASSYVPGLCFLLLGCWLLARAGRRPALWTAAAAGMVLAAALGFWFPYVWALPATGLLPPLLAGFDRARLRMTAVAAASCALVVGLMNATALAVQGIYTAGGALAWVKASQHGIHDIGGIPRMIFGLARSFIYLGEDGTLYRRYLGRDPLNPVSLADVLKSLWPIALFYLFLAALVLGLACSPRGRRLLILLLLAAVPVLGFGIAWQGGDMERYLPLYPFLFLALADFLGSERLPYLCRGLPLAFFAVMAVCNAAALGRPVLDQRHQELSERASTLAPHLRPHSRLFVVNDEVVKLRRNYPLNPLGHRLPAYAVFEAGTTKKAEWRALVEKRMRDTWKQGGDVWVSRRVFHPQPRAEWLWVENQNAELRWKHVYRFFQDFEPVETIGGEDGYVRLAAPAS